MKKHRNQGKHGSRILLKVTYSKLAKLFGRDNRTIRRWVYDGKLDPTDLQDIIEKYNSPHLLDKRRKEE